MSSSSYSDARITSAIKKSNSKKNPVLESPSYKIVIDKIRYDEFVPTVIKEEGKFNYCESRFVFTDRMEKLLLVEFKFKKFPALSKLEFISKTIVKELNVHFKINSSFHHFSFNGTNVLEIYIKLHQSPVPKKKDSAYHSDSSKNSDGNSWRRRETPPQSTPPRHAGELEMKSFNSSPVVMPIIRTSAATQTSMALSSTSTDDSQSAATITPAKTPANAIPLDYASLEFNEKIYHSRLSDNVTFSRTRDVLAYYESHRSATYQGESYVSTMNMLANDGLNTTPTNLRKIYFSLLKQRGFTDQEINKDLENRKNYILTDTVMRVSNAERTFHQRYSSGQEYKRGTCDPELCTIT